ncbi:hypothetical protein B0T16DRAFT_46582 [Cercophora newfieldiana]|uniref:Uncharacterized protein n=1 Tax=Cercophora newfieldiana TaxID=92897 RepID=A0AA40D191_9PEZI|nr:hypothetical protein B0T16DRAFT_46582 [Cercophora newfieldiana]
MRGFPFASQRALQQHLSYIPLLLLSLPTLPTKPCVCPACNSHLVSRFERLPRTAHQIWRIHCSDVSRSACLHTQKANMQASATRHINHGCSMGRPSLDAHSDRVDSHPPFPRKSRSAPSVSETMSGASNTTMARWVEEVLPLGHSAFPAPGWQCSTLCWAEPPPPHPLP